MGSDLAPSPLTWTQSLLWLALGVLAMLVSALVLAVATLPGVLQPLLFQPLGLTAGLARGLAYFGIQATVEETTKAIGIGVAKLRRNRLSWFWITFVIAGTSGALERVLWLINATPEARNRLPDTIALLLDTRTALGHVAFSLLCVTIARLVGRRGIGWLAGIAVAGAIHMLHNVLPMRIDFGGEFVWPAITGALSLLIVGVAFALRKRLDWRS